VKVDFVKIHSGVAPESNQTRAVAPDRVGKLTVVGVAVVASLGLLPWLGISMFADEGATLYSAHLSWSNLWSQSRHVDLVLLPYYVLIHFWLMVSGDIAWVRALSLFAYFGTIVVAGWTGLRIAGKWCGIIAAVLTATSTLLIVKSLNARPYELSTLLVALCAFFLIKWLDDSRTRWMWAFSILALLATAMQLFSLLAPTAMLICVLVVRPGLIAHRLRVLLAPIGLLAVVSGAWVVASIREVGQVNWIANESASSRLLAEVRGPLIGEFYGLVLLVIVVLVATKVAAALWNRPGRDAVVQRVRADRDVLALTIGWAVVPTIVLSVASVVHPIYSDRYVTSSAPGAALLVAFVCVRVFRDTLGPFRVSDRTATSRLPRQIMATLGVIAVYVLAIGYFSSASALQEDLRSPARYVAMNVQHGDAIALPDHAISSAIQYYLASEHQHVPLWPQLGVQQQYVEGFDLSLAPSSTGSIPRRAWLVTDASVPGVDLFEATLQYEGYALVQQQQFTGVTLLLYETWR
jgi:mannosyltransferase